jgi:hypothetical protein
MMEHKSFRHSSEASSRPASSSARPSHSTSAVKVERKSKKADCDVRSPLSVRDFAGTWAITSNTTGGLSGNTGASTATIGQVKFDTRGQGTGSFKGARYNGPIGTGLVDASAAGLTFAIRAIDPKTGYARIEATDPTLSKITTTLDVIVTRATSGKATQMNGVDVTTTDLVVPVSGVFTTTFIRQNL